jgi:gas vesicle protein
MARKAEYEYGTAVTWFIAGGVVGACAALLLAPTSGERARARLAQGARDAKTSLANLKGDLAQKAARVRGGAAQVADDVVSTGQEAVDSI